MRIHADPDPKHWSLQYLTKGAKEKGKSSWHCPPIKGIVLRDWGGLQIISLYRYRSRISRRKISSQLTTWEKPVFRGAKCSIVEFRWNSHLRTENNI
jgi:hypothetical protein